MLQFSKIFSGIVIGALLLSAFPCQAQSQDQGLDQRLKADLLFEWAETLAPEAFIPVQPETRYFLGIHYRHYHESDTMLATFDGGLFYIDDHDIHYLGEVDYWIDYMNNTVTGSYYGKFLEFVLEGLTDAAQGEIGDDILGLILSILGWGDDGNDQDHKLLEEMDGKLDEIINILQAISEELAHLETVLNIMEEEILANVNDPTSAITQIRTFQDELQAMNKDKKPGGVSTDKILDFAEKVEDNFQIENDVNAIHDAILPPTVVKSPVLNNLTDLCINRISQGQSLSDAYQMLELYFSQLIYNQLKGVNIVVEAKLAREKSGYYDPGTAKHYMNNYITKILSPQVDNFQQNVWRMILSQVDLINAATFLPSQAGNILARADFFVAQIRGESAGLRGYLISTTDLLDDAPQLAAAIHEQAGASPLETSWIDPEHAKMNTASGRAYDHWQGNRVSRVSDYYVISYDFGDQKPGHYDIYQKDASGTYQLKTSSVVEKYDHDFQKDDQGEVSFGSFLFSRRVGAKEAFDQNVEWKWFTEDMENSSSSGSASSRYVKIEGGSQNEEYSGKGRLHASFVYAGEKPVPITFHYHARVSGSTSSSANTYVGGFAKSSIYSAVGIADGHTGHYQHHDVAEKSTGDNGKAGMNHSVNAKWTMKDPVPGREYYFYFDCKIEGDSYRGSARGDIKLDDIKGNQYISFW